MCHMAASRTASSLTPQLTRADHSFSTMSLESIKFGKDLPGYEYGNKEGPALIVIQVCPRAEYGLASQVAPCLFGNDSAEQDCILLPGVVGSHG